ncbi:tRNA guanosine(34) transglycosylase Tgt [bacterium Unc6]|nr:tRNA guanosine(34) transglycosylase Tgt [bacterium Unc6]
MLDSSFKIDGKDNSARLGILYTKSGPVQTPAFMPVGTQAAVKTLTPDEVQQSGFKMLLCNAYHLYLRPGVDIIKKSGGLHNFMNWDGSILTDSGGFQVFSLATLRKVFDDGVEFQSHIDGSKHYLTAEKVLGIQTDLNTDVIMPLDECVAFPSSEEHAKRAVKRTVKWAKLSFNSFNQNVKNSDKKSLLFCIIQGSTYQNLRIECCNELTQIPFSGYAIGGISVGEPTSLIREIVSLTVEKLPLNKPRCLMGVGAPLDILDSISKGIDLFDCIMPTRCGRNGAAFVTQGRLFVKNAIYSSDDEPVQQGCPCPCCKNFSRSYIRHLFNASEALGPRLLTIHNLWFYSALLRTARNRIKEQRFLDFKKKFEDIYDNKEDVDITKILDF